MNPTIDISATVLTTPRLTLRPWRMSDLDDLYAYASVDGVGQMAGWTPHESREISRLILDRFIREKKTFALVSKGQVIGSLGIEEYDELQFPELAPLRCREIGYVLSKAFWGQGLMPEAVRQTLRYLFEEVRLDAVLCGHFPDNFQSARVQAKCGFRHFAFSRVRTQDGSTRPEEMNILTLTQWQTDRTQ